MDHTQNSNMTDYDGRYSDSKSQSVNVNDHEKKLDFVEMRSVEEAINAMALDEIIFEVQRPSYYNPSLAATLGPGQPDPNLNLSVAALMPSSAGGLEGQDCIFVGGFPCYFTEAQVIELMEAFGPLRSFDLVKDRETGDSKATLFCGYQDLSITDKVCVALNGIKMGEKTLTVAPVKVRRPTNYNSTLASTLGSSQYPNLNLSLVGLTSSFAGGFEGPSFASGFEGSSFASGLDRIFVGGFPCYFTEAQVIELLEAFGPLRSFDLVKDRETGNSKGYAFCGYQDLSITNFACAALNGIKMGDKTLTVRRFMSCI